jgi:hypothetical protein
MRSYQPADKTQEQVWHEAVVGGPAFDPHHKPRAFRPDTRPRTATLHVGGGANFGCACCGEPLEGPRVLLSGGGIPSVMLRAECYQVARVWEVAEVLRV